MVEGQGGRVGHSQQTLWRVFVYKKNLFGEAPDITDCLTPPPHLKAFQYNYYFVLYQGCM